MRPALALSMLLLAPTAWAMPPSPSALVQKGVDAVVDVKVRRIGQVRPISTTAPPPGHALTGKHRLLVVLVETKDARWPKRYDRSRFEEMIFARSTLSLREYYRENSYGTYDVVGEVVGPLRIKGSIDDYGFKMGDPNGPVTALVELAVRAAGQRVNLDNYDKHDIRGRTGGDGILDHVIVMYPASSDEPDEFGPIWPHRGSMDFDAGKIRVNSYIVAGHNVPLGVLVHEFAHDIGLPDLYDRDYTSHGAGRWCLMAAGSWAGAGAVPSHLSAWAKDRMGWLTPRLIAKTEAGIELKSSSEVPFALKLPIGSVDAREYFLLENRRRVGFDRKLPAEGLLVWHIDERKTDNDDERWKMVDVVEAAPVQDLDFLEQGRLPDHSPDVFRLERANVFSDDTVPSAKSNDGTPSDIRIDVRSDAGRTITLDIQRPEIFNPGGVPFVLDNDSYRYGRFSVVSTGKGSEALVPFEATPGGFLAYGARIFFNGPPNTKGRATIRLYADAAGLPGKVLLTKKLKLRTQADGFDWVNTRLVSGKDGLKLDDKQRFWAGVTTEDGKIHVAHNPFSVTERSRFRRKPTGRLISSFNFRDGRKPVPDYIIRITGFGYVEGDEKPEARATMEDELVQAMQAADVRAEDSKYEEALERYVSVLGEMQRDLSRYDGWIPVVINSIGVTAYRLGKYGLARENFEIALRRVQSAKDEPNAADIFQNLCETAFKGGDAKAAGGYCDRSRRLNARLGRKDRLVENLYWQARCHQSTEPPDAAGASRRLDEALEIAQEAFAKDEEALAAWRKRIAAAKGSKPVDEDRVIERMKSLEADTQGRQEKAQYTDLLQFLLDDTQKR